MVRFRKRDKETEDEFTARKSAGLNREERALQILNNDQTFQKATFHFKQVKTIVTDEDGKPVGQEDVLLKPSSIYKLYEVWTLPELMDLAEAGVIKSSDVVQL